MMHDLVKYTSIVVVVVVFVVVYAMYVQESNVWDHVCFHAVTNVCQRTHIASTCDINSYAVMQYPLWCDGMLTFAYRIMNAQIWHSKCRWDLFSQIAHQPRLHFVLHSDETFPTDFSADQITQMYQEAEHVYAQNLDRSKLTDAQNKVTTCIPIGLDLHTVSGSANWGVEKEPSHQQFNRLRQLRTNALELPRRTRKVLVTWLPSSTSSDRFAVQQYKTRPQLYNECLANSHFAIGTGNRNETWSAMSRHAFVYSPIGNGFDCHRTWEALSLGCIILAQRNPALEAILSDHPDLPIWFCDEPASVDGSLLDHLVLTMQPACLDKLRLPNFVAHARHYINT